MSTTKMNEKRSLSAEWHNKPKDKRVNQRLKGIDLERFNELSSIFGTDKAGLQIALISWESRLIEIRDSFLYKLLCDRERNGFNVANIFAQLKASIHKLEKRERENFIKKGGL